MILFAITVLVAVGALVRVLVATSTVDRILGGSALESALTESEPVGPVAVPHPRDEHMPASPVRR